MPDLTAIARDALDRAMRAAGWEELTTDAYERAVTPAFTLRAQFWFDGTPVEVQALISMIAPRVDSALPELGEEQLDSAVTRDPLDHGVVIKDVEAVDTAVADLVRQLDSAAERMHRYADVDAFIEAIRSDENTCDDARVVVPILLAVSGRQREAQARAQSAPGDFPDRFTRWLAGERPPPQLGSEETFTWSDAFRAAWRKAREQRAQSPAAGSERPQASWRDVLRAGRSVSRAFRGHLPPSTVIPDPARPWTPVELAPTATPVLEHAHEESPLPLLQGAFVEARLEQASSGRLRVLLGGAEVGTVAAPEGTRPAIVSGKIAHGPGDGPLELAVQLPGFD